MSDVAGPGSGAWRDRPSLSGADLADFLALRQVCGRPDSSVHQVGEHFVANQRPVVVTASGLARYEELCARQGLAPYPSVVIEGTP